MGFQEYAVALIGTAVLVIAVRKIYRIAKGKDNACSCCDKKGCCNCSIKTEKKKE